jgi:hypothetical protein
MANPMQGMGDKAMTAKQKAIEAIGECVRCGECCRRIPCEFAQMRFHLKKGDKCPSLVYDGAPYTCMWIHEDTWFKNIMVGSGCDYPEWQTLPA